uniref:Uncharacterized protein n=1 Tax=Globodera rostochiensis TaxID=31243 RepID=A0A914GXG1_GLORO
MSVVAGRKVLIDPYEWPRVLAALKAQRPPTDSWNYDPPWYDNILIRDEGMHKRMSSTDGGEREDGSMGKRLFVARIGKRMAHGYWARVG